MYLVHSRIKAERRPNGIFVGNVLIQVAASQRRYGRKIPPTGQSLMTEDTLLALGFEKWSLQFRRARLHFCSQCQAPYIGHCSTRLCSDECVQSNRAAWFEAHRQPKIQRPPSRAEQRRAKLAKARCLCCDASIQPTRLTAQFCSGACRQKHHRRTLKENGSGPEVRLQKVEG